MPVAQEAGVVLVGPALRDRGVELALGVGRAGPRRSASIAWGESRISSSRSERDHAAGSIRPAHLAELDLAGAAAQDDLVAVLEERSRAAVRQLERLRAVPRQLDQAPLGAALGPRDRARSPSGRPCGGSRR